MFVGVNIPDLTFPATPENAVSSARMFLSHPSTFITASDPRIFGDQEIVIRDQSTGTDYTPQRLAARCSPTPACPWANPIGDAYIGGVPFADPAHFPNVDVYAEKGSGIETLVGLGLTDLTIGQQVTRHDRVPDARRRHQPGGPHERRRARPGPGWRATTSA